jgi:hypothetical protein
MVTGFPDSGPFVPSRRSGSSGCVPLKKHTFGPISVRAPMVMVHVSMNVQLKLMNTPLPTLMFVP